MLLHHAFEATAVRLPQKLALVSGDTRLSYEALLRRVIDLSQRLHEAGIACGDRVVLLLESDWRYAVAVHAVLRLGAVIVPLTPTTKADKLAFVLADTTAAALLVDDRLAGPAAGLRDLCPLLRVVLTGAAFESQGPRAAPPIAEVTLEEDLAAIIYTSGSTGRPKGVMLTHRNMVSAWTSVQAYLGLREDDVIALALPPMFSYGLYHVLMGLGLGGTLVLERQAAFPIKLAQTLERERATVMPAVPTLLASLLELRELAGFDHRTLRLMSNAAAALPVAYVPRICSAWPHARFLSMYGMTECKRISYLPPEELERRPASVGRGMPGQEHWLIDEGGRRLGLGAVGELVVRGAHVMRGYWQRDDETAQRLRPGPDGHGPALHTGDLFRCDGEGFLYFVSRMDDIIKTRGEKVAPREVEDVIHQLAQVSACAVVGIPDALLGHAVKAYVTLVEGAMLGEREVIRHCQARLESHMVPRVVSIVTELPQTESGKVRHAALRSQ